MRDILNITKALADRNRVRIVMALTGAELCVCQIIELLSLAPSTVSKHLHILHQAGLVEARKQGRWVHYRLPDGDAPKAATNAIAWLQRHLKSDREVLMDAKRLKAILKLDPEELCKRQGRN